MTGSDWGRATSGDDAATLVSSEAAPDLERAYWATLCVFVQEDEDIISTRTTAVVGEVSMCARMHEIRTKIESSSCSKVTGFKATCLSLNGFFHCAHEDGRTADEFSGRQRRGHSYLIVTNKACDDLRWRDGQLLAYLKVRRLRVSHASERIRSEEVLTFSNALFRSARKLGRTKKLQSYSLSSCRREKTHREIEIRGWYGDACSPPLILCLHRPGKEISHS